MEFLTSVPFLMTANLLFVIYLLIGNTIEYAQAVSALGASLQNSITKKKADAGASQADKPRYQKTPAFVSSHAHGPVKPNDYEAFLQKQEADKAAFDRISAQESINNKIKQRIQTRWMIAVKIVGFLLLIGNMYKLNQLYDSQ